MASMCSQVRSSNDPGLRGEEGVVEGEVTEERGERMRPHVMVRGVMVRGG